MGADDAVVAGIGVTTAMGVGAGVAAMGVVEGTVAGAEARGVGGAVAAGIVGRCEMNVCPVTIGLEI